MPRDLFDHPRTALEGKYAYDKSSVRHCKVAQGQAKNYRQKLDVELSRLRSVLSRNNLLIRSQNPPPPSSSLLVMAKSSIIMLSKDDKIGTID